MRLAELLPESRLWVMRSRAQDWSALARSVCEASRHAAAAGGRQQAETEAATMTALACQVAAASLSPYCFVLQGDARGGHKHMPSYLLTATLGLPIVGVPPGPINRANLEHLVSTKAGARQVGLDCLHMLGGCGEFGVEVIWRVMVTLRAGSHTLFVAQRIRGAAGGQVYREWPRKRPLQLSSTDGKLSRRRPICLQGEPARLRELPGRPRRCIGFCCGGRGSRAQGRGRGRDDSG